MRNFIIKKLRENLTIPKLGISQAIKITPELINKIKNINWNELKIIENGSEGNIHHFNIEIPNTNKQLTNNLIVDIQIIKDYIYQIHINIPKQIQGYKLGYKIYKKMIYYLGALYSGKGRRQNPIVNKIWDRLKTDNDVECHSNNIADICFSKNVPEEEKKNILTQF